MEFKYLSGYDLPYPIQSYSINMLTGPEGENRRSDLVPMQMIGRDSLRREIEKELIREEIEARRQEIEEEVRMEIAIERELAFRTPVGGRFSPSSSSLSLQHLQRTQQLQERRLVQRESGRGKGWKPEMGEEKLKSFSADNILAGSKRKATIDSQLLHTASPKKAHNPLRCALCGVTVTSEQCLRQHFEGKKHKAKEERGNTCNEGHCCIYIPVQAL